jgi:hypothetical protein
MTHPFSQALTEYQAQVAEAQHIAEQRLRVDGVLVNGVRVNRG